MNLSGYQYGIETAEVAINLENFSITYRPEYKKFLPNHLGQSLGFVVPSIPSAEVSLSGEVNAATNLMAATFVAAQTIANDSALFGRSAGGFYLDEATEDQSREGWRKISMKFTAHPLIP